MDIFSFCCPIVPLLPRNENYPEDYALPPRIRPSDAINIPKLISNLSDSILFRKQQAGLDLGFVHVLSPYSFQTHVMLLDLSPNRLLAGPEFFNSFEWSAICNLCKNAISFLEQNTCEVTALGFNWSPYSYGEFEEKEGGQSITTKFHMMIWQWDQIQFCNYEDLKIPISKQFVFQNKYNQIFGQLIFNQFQKYYPNFILTHFSQPIFSSLGLFLPFKDSSIQTVLSLSEDFHQLTILVINCIKHLSSCLVSDFYEEMYTTLKMSEKRPLTKEELSILRKMPQIRTKEEALSLSNSSEESELIHIFYESVLNRINKDSHSLMWKKGFGFSFVIEDWKGPHSNKSGLRVMLIPYCGPGGVAEASGCYLTRPESFLAKPQDMIIHNNLQWDLSDFLNNTM